jgi:DNA replication protein DnaC
MSKMTKELCKLDVLLIDDVGKRRLTETAGELLYDLLDKVYLGAANCRLWFTSNLTIAGLAERFAVKDVGSAFAARIDRLIDGGQMERLDA